jgi:transposase
LSTEPVGDGFEIFCGVDVAKASHHVVALTANGRRLVDSKVANDETALTALVSKLVESAGGPARLLIVVDQPASIGALPVAVARGHHVPVAYLPGLSMRRLADLHPGQAKTDARDAFVIADAARTLPHTLRAVGRDEEALAGLAVLIGYDEDLAAEVTRLSNRLRDAMLSIHPALERLLGPRLDCPGVPTLLQAAPTPAALTQLDDTQLAELLHQGGSPRLAKTLPEQIRHALAAQTVTVPGTADFGRVIAGLARQLATARAERRQLAITVEERLDAHPLAEVLTSMPGIGVRTATQLLTILGDGSAFASAAHLASYAGLAPVTRQSGTSIRGEHANRRGHRALKAALYRSAFASLKDPASRAYYQRKRDQGKHHVAAVTCLARRRVDVLYAMLRDRTPYRPDTSTTCPTG